MPGKHLEAPIVYKGISLGFLICWDIEFPEPIRALRMQGAQVIITHGGTKHTTYLSHSFLFGFINSSFAANTDQFVVDSMVPTRAYENLAFVVYANRVGREVDMMCGGMKKE